MTPAALSLVSVVEYANFALRLADAAAGVTLPLFRQPMPIEVKSDASPFTVADCDAEGAMCSLIRECYPQHGMLGEEFGAHNIDADYVWVLDPIDGTRSFISGSPQYASMIALLYQGMPILSVVDFPALHERYSGLYIADCCQMRFNGAPHSVCRLTPRIEKAVVATTTIAVSDTAQDTQLRHLLAACGHVRLGGDAHPYAGVAAGFMHAAADYLMQPYDYLPLVPLIAGGGGMISDWQGDALVPFDNNDNGAKTVLASSDEILHLQMLRALAAQA